MSRPFNQIAPFHVARYGMGFAVFNGSEVIQSGFDCRGDAVGYAHDLLDEREAEAEALAEEAYQDEIDRLRDLVNAQGGYVAPSDVAGLARGRAIDAVLAAIDTIGVSAREAA